MLPQVNEWKNISSSRKKFDGSLSEAEPESSASLGAVSTQLESIRTQRQRAEGRGLFKPIERRLGSMSGISLSSG